MQMEDAYEKVAGYIATDESVPAKIRELAEEKAADACWEIASDEALGRAFFGSERRRSAVRDLGKEGRIFISVSCDFIDEAMEMLAAKFPGVGTRLVGTTLSRMLTEMVIVRDSPGERVIDMIGNAFRGFRGVALVPLHVPLTAENEMEHWVLGAIDFGRSGIKIYDSSEDSASIRAVLRTVVEIMKNSLESVTGSTFAVSDARATQQKNNADCGVCCVESARRIVSGEQVDRKTAWPDVRRDMTVELVAWWRSGRAGAF